MKNAILGLILAQCVFAFASDNEVAKSFITHDGLQLNGLVTYPDQTTTKQPAVLLIHGAGTLDRNMWIPGTFSATGQPHKAFETIAQSLAANGIISYRYDKRGITYQPGGAPLVNRAIYDAISLEALISDAKVALGVLQADPKVDAKRILVLGFSQGTRIAPQVARGSSVAGIVLMSSIGHSGNAGVVAALKIPTLLLQGEIDVLTPLAQVHLIVQALKAAGSTNYKLITYPGLGHGFSPNLGSMPTLGPIDPGVTEALPTWINANF